MKPQLGYELKRTQQALRSSMDEALSELSLTTPQYAALTVLEAAPGVSSAELARRCFVTPQTMQAIVAALERRRLLGREARPGQGRMLPVELTRRGRALVARAHDAVDAIEQRMSSGLTEIERRRLFDLLRRCAGALQAPSTSSVVALGPVRERKR